MVDHLVNTSILFFKGMMESLFVFAFFSCQLLLMFLIQYLLILQEKNTKRTEFILLTNILSYCKDLLIILGRTII